MAHTFPPIPAKPAFGTIVESANQCDYLRRKKALLSYCNNVTNCRRLRSYEEINLYRNGRRGAMKPCNSLPFNKANLIAGQYTKMNLANVCTAIVQPLCNNQTCTHDNPADCCNACKKGITFKVDPDTGYIIEPNNNKPFYSNFYIDPIGNLFGNNQCGELNYTAYMMVNPRTVT